MKKSLLMVALLGMGGALPGVAAAEDAAPESPHSFSGNVGLYSQYVWRGMTQTDEELALQGGADYAHSSGFYAGAWASNVSWTTDTDLYKSGGTLELDLYAGFGGEFGETGIGYDVGVLQYLYPGSQASGKVEADATEVYAGLSYGWFSGKYSYTVSDEAWGFDDAEGTQYIEAAADIPLGESGFTLNLHVGTFLFDGETDGADNDDYDYTDWKVGVTKSWDNGIDVGAYYTDNDASTSDGWVKEMTQEQFTVFVAKSF